MDKFKRRAQVLKPDKPEGFRINDLYLSDCFSVVFEHVKSISKIFSGCIKCWQHGGSLETM